LPWDFKKLLREEPYEKQYYREFSSYLNIFRILIFRELWIGLLPERHRHHRVAIMLVSFSHSILGNFGDEAEDAKYALSGFIFHRGESTQVGHYVAYVRDKNAWILFNDDRVSEIDVPPANQCYIALYSRYSHSENI
jgi:Ubiquitin carboxyl-terminal hydrolase